MFVITREEILLEAKNCTSYAKIGKVFNVSRQRVEQLVTKYEIKEQVKAIIDENKLDELVERRKTRVGPICCVYAVYFNHNKKYIGSSTNYMSRYSNHKSLLSQGIHHSETLQKESDSYGYKKLKVQILKITDKENIQKDEQRFIDAFGLDSLHNTKRARFEVGEIKKSKYPNIYYHRYSETWKGQIYYNGEYKHTGYYKDEEDAFCALMSLKEELGLLKQEELCINQTR